MKKALIVLLVLSAVGCKQTPNLPNIEPKVIYVPDSITSVMMDSIIVHHKIYIDGNAFIITNAPNAE